jgi:putative transposase
MFFRELKEESRVDGMDYLTALAKTERLGDLNYTDRNTIEKLFQTYTRHVGRFHKIWNSSQSSAERWLTGYTAYYTHLRSYQALEN